MSPGGIAWGSVTIDCVDTARVAEFYAALLGTHATAAGPDRPGWVRIAPLVPGGPSLTFQPVLEPAHGKVRAHLDLWVDDLADATERVEALGGRVVGAVQHLERGAIQVVTDPEGNELCLLGAPASGDVRSR